MQFFAPETIASRTMGLPSDLWALGVVLFMTVGLQPCAVEAATLCGRGCNPMRQRLHPYFGTLYDGGRLAPL
mgnify:CR=1 FL=1